MAACGQRDPNPDPPQCAHSKLCTTMLGRVVVCGLTTAGLSGLRHFGEVSFIKRSKDRVGLLWRWGDGATE
jgi:hypothetical protein